jgi:mannose-1-phosphate guanylyltransferase
VSALHAVIMAGGRGTRFWPASREALPKQFLKVGGDESLLRRTARRLYPLVGEENVWVVTNAAHVSVVAEHLPEIRRARIVGEPVGRNTAPCAGLAAALVARESPEAVLLMAPADHWINDEDGFRRTAAVAARAAAELGGLITFGIVPSSPETGYGYIEAAAGGEGPVRKVARFTEKPDRPTAEKFLAGGRHLWNSGIFAWRADAFLEELEASRPQLADACRRIAAAADRDAALAEVYPECEGISVDYAVLERSQRVYVVPSAFAWSDVGSWAALGEVLPVDENGNTIEGDALTIDTRGCLVRSSQRLAALVGLEDLLIVDTPDALLVCAKDRAQDVKKLVEALEERGRRDLL